MLIEELQNRGLSPYSYCPGVQSQEFNTGDTDLLAILMRVAWDQTEQLRLERWCDTVFSESQNV